jgi:type I restriction enzyme, S subunit
MTHRSDWSVVRLADLAAPGKGSIAGGPFGSDLVSADYVTEGVPVIRGTNLPLDHRLSLSGLVFVTEAKADSLHLNCAHPGDLVFTQRGTLGQVGLIPHDSPYPRYLISQSQMKMTVDPLKADPLYLYYYFRLPSTVRYIENHALQAGVPHINLGILRKLEVVVPPLGVQKKIAAILSAYDDLIANNQRRIALLEGMAEEIYREWFVRMRFPGYASANWEHGLPAGWRAGSAAEVVSVLGGGTPRTEVPAYWDGEIPFFSPKDSHGGAICIETEQTVTEAGLESCASQLFEANTIFITARGTVGNIVLAGEPMAMNQSCYALVPKNKAHLYFVFVGLRCAVSVIKGVSNSGVFDNIVMDTFKIIPIIDPGPELAAKFSNLAKPMFEQSLALRQANQALRTQRDALLPRLISGKLKVDHLDIRLPPSMRTGAEAVA